MTDARNSSRPAPDARPVPATGVIEERIAAASAVLGVAIGTDGLERLARFARLVCKWRSIVNLTAASTPLEFAERHVVDCLAASRFAAGAHVLDVGSGAGLPGIVLAVARPQSAFVLLERRQRRARFLIQARIELGLGNVEVVNAGVQRYRPERPFDVIVCRAYGPLARFVADTRGLHHPACRLVALKGRDPGAEIAALGAGAGACTVHRVAVPNWAERHVVVVDCARLPGAGTRGRLGGGRGDVP